MGRHASVSHIPPLQIRPNTVFLRELVASVTSCKDGQCKKRTLFLFCFPFPFFVVCKTLRGETGVRANLNSFNFFVQSKRRVAHIQLGRKGKERDPRTFGSPEKQKIGKFRARTKKIPIPRLFCPDLARRLEISSLRIRHTFLPSLFPKKDFFYFSLTSV